MEFGQLYRCGCLRCLQIDIDFLQFPQFQDCFCGLCESCVRKTRLVREFYEEALPDILSVSSRRRYRSGIEFVSLIPWKKGGDVK